MDEKPKTMQLTEKLGRSPTRGYVMLWDGISFLLRETRKNGAYVVTGVVRIPKNQDDALRLCQFILTHTHGELSAQAILASMEV